MMRSVRWLMLAMLMGLCPPIGSQPSPAPDTIRIATLNLWHSGKDLDKRTRGTIRELAALEPDWIGLQEVSGSIWRPNRARLLAEALQGRFVYQPSDGTRWVFAEGLAILGHHPMSQVQRTMLSHSKRWPLERRFIQWVQTRLPDGQPFIVFNTHLTHRNPHAYQIERLEQVLDILNVVAAVALSQDIPAVLVGDMNSFPDHLAMKALCGTLLGGPPPFADVWASAGRDHGTTICPTNDYQSDEQLPARIDYVLTLNGTSTRLHPVHAWRFATKPDSVSDHYGVVADLRHQPSQHLISNHPAGAALQLRHRQQAFEMGQDLLKRTLRMQQTLASMRRQLQAGAKLPRSHDLRHRLLQVVQFNLIDAKQNPAWIGPSPDWIPAKEPFVKQPMLAFDAP